MMTKDRRLVCMALTLAALAAGCSKEKATQIVVAMATNLSVPKEMDNISFKVEQRNTVKADLNYTLKPQDPGSFELPATVAIHAGKDPSIPITITVTGEKNNKTVVTRRARLPFIEGRILLLKMDLLRSCAGRSCPTNQTCTEKGCVSMDVDPKELPDYHQSKAFLSPEAGAGDAAPPDASLDAPMPDAKPVPDAPLPTCKDGKHNGAETDIDCGGGTCPTCAAGKKCKQAGDCASGICTSGLCATVSCTDKVKNGDETDIDCGGASCPKCEAAKGCQRAPTARAASATARVSA